MHASSFSANVLSCVPHLWTCRFRIVKKCSSPQLCPRRGIQGSPSDTNKGRGNDEWLPCAAGPPGVPRESRSCVPSAAVELTRERGERGRERRGSLLAGADVAGSRRWKRRCLSERRRPVADQAADSAGARWWQLAAALFRTGAARRCSSRHAHSLIEGGAGSVIRLSRSSEERGDAPTKSRGSCRHCSVTQVPGLPAPVAVATTTISPHPLSRQRRYYAVRAGRAVGSTGACSAAAGSAGVAAGTPDGAAGRSGSCDEKHNATQSRGALTHTAHSTRTAACRNATSAAAR